MNFSVNQLEKVMAVVVTYFPDPFLEDRVRKISAQFKEVLIIDNTPTEKPTVCFQALMKFPNLSIIHMKRNTGVAFAFNQGVQYAKNHGYSWVGTFDQDSIIPENFLHDAFLALDSFSQKENVAILSPVYILPDGTKKCFFNKKNRANAVREVSLTMSSGNIIDISKVEEVGGFDDYLFIDYVDYDLCLRLRSHGFLILENEKIFLKHELGTNFVSRQFLWKHVGVPHYPSKRIYFSTRNRLILYSRYWKRFPGFVIDDMLRIPMVVIKILLFESEKMEKIKAFFLGLIDGVNQRLDKSSHG